MTITRFLQANLGNLNRLSDQLPMIFANMALLQCQSTVATLVACLLAIFKGLAFNEDFELSNVAFLVAGALAAINLATLLLSSIMSAVVILSKKYEKNPENIAPAIAASFGDLTTLALLATSVVLLQDHRALGGNLAAIFSCSLSSYLFRVSQLGVLPAGERTCTGPVQMFWPRGEMSNVAIVLLVVVLPGQTLFAVLSKVLRFGYISMSLAFLLAYLAASLAQVAVLLYLCRLLVYALWRCRVDPDNAAIPFLAGTGDFLGTGLLTLAFFALEALGDPGAHDEAAFDRPPMDGPRWGSMTKTTVAVRGDSKKPRLGPNATFSGSGRQP
ncbi:solute carrier family 41 member 1-like [Ixodes scapularis]|uniref:solute carrier family 41 member 1-like n=1 Tax=Ixodes scapularis TaxID=6945 RepID=UPI001AD6DC79|nr:solute carrier family 41 member 1-like [Ixodes scapularis]